MGSIACRTTGSGLERFEYTQRLMGVEARVVLWAPSEERALLAATAAFGRMRELEGALSDWRDDSELSRLVAQAGGPPVPVGADLFSVLSLAQELAWETEGAFDPTVGPLVALWREARAAGRLPDEDALAGARRRTGWERLELDPSARTARLAAGTRLDLGGIGKGFACDRALDTLAEHGVPRALVEIGGDLALGAPPPNRDGWVIAVGCDDGATPLVLAEVGVATSGDSEQFVEVDGVRYSHVLDPRTGRGVTDGGCVTVVASDGATADALASALSVLGARGEGRITASRPEVRVLFGPGPGGPK